MNFVSFVVGAVLSVQMVAGAHALESPAAKSAPSQNTMAAAEEFVGVIFAAQDLEAHSKTIVEGMLIQMASDTKMKSFFEQNPKMVGELRTAWVELFVKASKKLRPQMLREIAELYAGGMTVDELREVTSFFRSPMGQRLLTGVQSNMTYASSTKEIVSGALANAKDVPEVSRTAVDSDRDGAAARTVGEMSPEDRQALNNAASRPAMRALLALRDKRSAIETKWFNASDPESEKEIEAVTSSIMQRYAGKTAAK